MRGPSVLWALFGFDGRIGREVFWLGNLLFFIIGWAFARANMMIIMNPTSGEIGLGHPATPLVFVVLVWSEVALVVKRLHDRGLTGWIALFLPVPVLSILGFIVVGLIPGQPGPNAYARGPNQRGS